MSACRVKVMATPDGQSVHIEEAGNLLFAAEDGESLDLAWRFIRTHDITGFDLRLSPALPLKSRREIVRKVNWLMGRITARRAPKKNNNREVTNIDD